MEEVHFPMNSYNWNLYAYVYPYIYTEIHTEKSLLLTLEMGNRVLYHYFVLFCLVLVGQGKGNLDDDKWVEVRK